MGVLTRLPFVVYLKTKTYTDEEMDSIYFPKPHLLTVGDEIRRCDYYWNVYGVVATKPWLSLKI